MSIYSEPECMMLRLEVAEVELYVVQNGSFKADVRVKRLCT